MQFELRAFPEGTDVTLYQAANWPAWVQQPEGEPLGEAVGGDTVEDGVAVLTVAVGERYWAAAEVDGEWRYVRVFVPAPTIASGDVELPHLVGSAGEPDFVTKAIDGKQVAVAEGELENGWTGEEAAAYQGFADGSVEITVVKANHVGPSAATIFTLPEGFRPAEKVVGPVLTIEVDGQVKPTVAAEELENVEQKIAASEFVPQQIGWEVFEDGDVTFFKDREVVRVNGIVLDTHDSLGGGVDPVFVLPEGYRPARRVYAGPDKWVDPTGEVFSDERIEGEGEPHLLDGLAFRVG